MENYNEKTKIQQTENNINMQYICENIRKLPIKGFIFLNNIIQC